MKLVAVIQGGSKKDFVDLYALALKHKPLGELLRLYQRKYSRDDAVFSDDCVEFFLSPPDSGVLSGFPESSRYFHFAINSRGVQYDEVGMSSPSNWDASWQCQASVQADRWELEVALPFSELQTRVNDGTVWAVNFNRAQRAK